MRKTNHTPTPWKAFISGRTIEVQPQKGKPVVAWPGFDECDVPLAVHKANARFIVRAVNAHDDLLAVCEEVAAWIDEPGKGRALLYPHLADVILPKLKAAIAAAKGEK